MTQQLCASGFFHCVRVELGSDVENRTTTTPSDPVRFRFGQKSQNSRGCTTSHIFQGCLRCLWPNTVLFFDFWISFSSQHSNNCSEVEHFKGNNTGLLTRILKTCNLWGRVGTLMDIKLLDRKGEKTVLHVHDGGHDMNFYVEILSYFTIKVSCCRKLNPCDSARCWNFVRTLCCCDDWSNVLTWHSDCYYWN